ncbi:MAG TPA: Asp-tRNA(Asn)/Glu-tRNA(Gln) amidotransferase subunit GatB [Candidatus Paceibacterota bacterium]
MAIIRPSGKAYYPVIGLEIHAELKTKSKMFCSCKNDPDEPKPNQNICAVCMGHPGTLPVLNKQAIKHVLKVGHALGSKIADYTEWDRKNYFYPDIPKGYQISQFAYPLIKSGGLSVKADPKDIDPATGQPKKQYVELTRIHLEEDTASSSHDAPKDADGNSYSLVDFNRAGLPLMELVTEPVIYDSKTAAGFAKELQLLLRSLGAGDANMEKGEMRVEANISVSENPLAHQLPYDLKNFGRKVEVKNLNSFKSVERAIEFEIERHIDILERREIEIAAGATEEDMKKAGLFIAQETRGFDETTGKTFSQRAKEDSHDYRYFPDPDLPKLMISEVPEFAPDLLKAELGMLPWELRERYVKEFAMNDEAAEMFVQNSTFRDFFETVSKILADTEATKLAVNYITSDLAGLAAKTAKLAGDSTGPSGEKYEGGICVSAEDFAEIISMLKKGDLISRGAKDLLSHLWAAKLSEAYAVTVTDPKDAFFEGALYIGKKPRQIAEEKGMIQKNDPEALKKMIEELTAAHPTVVQDYLGGKEASLQFFVGQIMKLSKGSANPQVAKDALVDFLKK